jgi:hypothetical protein
MWTPPCSVDPTAVAVTRCRSRAVCSTRASPRDTECPVQRYCDRGCDLECGRRDRRARLGGYWGGSARDPRFPAEVRLPVMVAAGARPSGEPPPADLLPADRLTCRDPPACARKPYRSPALRPRSCLQRGSCSTQASRTVTQRRLACRTAGWRMLGRTARRWWPPCLAMSFGPRAC